MGLKRDHCFVASLVILTLFAVLLSAERGIRVMDRYSRSTLSSLPDYGDTWRKTPVLGKGGYLQPGFDKLVTDGRGGKVVWRNNRDRVRNTLDFDAFPPDGTLRIVSLGDSFTAGYRVGQEKTFSFLLEQYLANEGFPSEVLISCIEHPVDGLGWLKRFGLAYHPDIVMLGLTIGNDISQLYVALSDTKIGFQHGLEHQMVPENRFTGPQHPREQDPRPIYTVLAKLSGRLSRLRTVDVMLSLWSPPMDRHQSIVSWYAESGFRKVMLFDSVNGLGIFLRQQPKEISEAYRSLFRVLLDYKKPSRANGFALVVVLFPQRFQVQPLDWEATVNHYGLVPEAFDLSKPNRLIAEFCEEQSIMLIDPTKGMIETYEGNKRSLYLPAGDMHRNERGHCACFSAMRDQVRQTAWSALTRRTVPTVPK